MITEINSLDDIKALILMGVRDFTDYGEVNVDYNDDLILFNYAEKAQFSNRWNWFELHSRGWIFDLKTGEIIARCMKKFFNWLEPEKGGKPRQSSGKMVSITEKVDGSLINLYYYDGWKAASRGSLKSQHAQWAQALVDSQINIPEEYRHYTFVCELIHPENRIVVDYGDAYHLVLLKVLHTNSQYELSRKEVEDIADKYGFQPVKSYSFDTIDDIMSSLKIMTAHNEGYVIQFDDGQMFKFKSPAYLLAHRLRFSINFKHVLESVRSGEYEKMIDGIPDEFLIDIIEYKKIIDFRLNNILETTSTLMKLITSDYINSSEKMPRKDFALRVQALIKEPEYKHIKMGYLFNLYDGKDVIDLIYRTAFEDM